MTRDISSLFAVRSLSVFFTDCKGRTEGFTSDFKSRLGCVRLALQVPKLPNQKDSEEPVPFRCYVGSFLPCKHESKRLVFELVKILLKRVLAKRMNFLQAIGVDHNPMA